MDQYVGGDKRQPVIDWAKQEMAKGKYPRLAGDIYACLRLLQEKHGNDRSNADGSRPPRREMADYHEHFRKLINQSDAPLPVRLATAPLVLDQQAARRIPLALAHDAARLYVTALEKGVTVVSSQHRSSLSMLLSLRDEAECKELIGKWREAFARRYLHAPSQQGGSTTLNDSATACVALYLYLAVDDVERANMVLSRCDAVLSQSPSALASLLRFGKIDLALQFFRSHRLSLRHNWSDGDDQYDAAIAKGVAAFLPRLSDDGERFAAEALLATMPDAARPKKTSGKTPDGLHALPLREQRLLALAGRLKNVTFKDAAMKTMAVRALLASDKAAALIAADIAAEYAKIDLAQFTGHNDYSRMESVQAIVNYHVRNRLLANDVQPLVDSLNKLATVQNNGNYIFSQLGTPLLASCYAAVKKDDVRWTVDQSAKVAAALRGVTANRQDFFINDYREFVSLILLAHVRAGQAAELIKWQRDLPNSPRSNFREADPSVSIFHLLAKTVAPATKENVQTRLDYVRDVLRVSVANQWFAWDSHARNRMLGDSTPVFDRVVQSGLLKPEELSELGPAAVAKIDDAGLAKAALAAWFAAKKENGKATALWRAAVAAAPGKDSQQANYWRWSLARSLTASGNNDEARSVAKEVSEKRIQPEHRAELQKFRAGLESKKPAAPAQKPSK